MLLYQFLVLAGNKQFFCCGGKVLLRPEKKVLVVCLAGCAVVSVFGSGDYDRKKKSSSCPSGGLCCMLCQFLVLAGNRQFFIVLGKFYYDWKKKSSSPLSGGLCCCVSFWFWRLRTEKKVLVICLADCAVVLVFGSGGK